jgi:hypothetical protein
MARDTLADPTPTGPMVLVEIGQASSTLIDTGEPREQRLRGVRRRPSYPRRPARRVRSAPSSRSATPQSSLGITVEVGAIRGVRRAAVRVALDADHLALIDRRQHRTGIGAFMRADAGSSLQRDGEGFHAAAAPPHRTPANEGEWSSPA